MFNRYQDNTLQVSHNVLSQSMPRLETVVEAGKVVSASKFGLAVGGQGVELTPLNRLEAHRKHMANALKLVKNIRQSSRPNPLLRASSP
jgi:hypothetical protein